VADVDELKKVKKKYTWHLTNGMWVPRQQRPSQQWGGGPKLPKNQNIMVSFVFKLVRGP